MESVEFWDWGNSKSETSGSAGIGDCHNGDFGKYSSFWVSGDIGGFDEIVPIPKNLYFSNNDINTRFRVCLGGIVVELSSSVDDSQ